MFAVHPVQGSFQRGIKVIFSASYKSGLHFSISYYLYVLTEIGVRHMPFAEPMIWREPANHLKDCYFCLVNVEGFSAKLKQKIRYPNIRSVDPPISHSNDFPIPVPPNVRGEEVDNIEKIADILSESYSVATCSSNVGVRTMNQSDLNDLVNDLNLSKRQSELLASRLKERHFLEEDVHITFYRQRQKAFENFFGEENGLLYCHDVGAVLVALGHSHVPNEWRLFIDASKSSLKAALLHNGNQYPSIPVAYSVSMKETYDNLRLVLDKIRYDDHCWPICGDLKIISLLLGMQLGFTKHSCFLCEWDSRDRKKHYVKKKWPKRQNFLPGDKNVLHSPLVDPLLVLLPPLHIKLGLMKNFVKAMDQSGSGFEYIMAKFPEVSEAKKKEGVFIGPQILRLMKDQAFEKTLNKAELRAWCAFKKVCQGFLGNQKAQNYHKIIGEFLKA